MRLIDADELMDIAENQGNVTVDDIVNATTIDPVKHGRWIEDGDVQICSECGEEHEWVDYRASFCDNCGARMDGEV